MNGLSAFSSHENKVQHTNEKSFSLFTFKCLKTFMNEK